MTKHHEKTEKQRRLGRGLAALLGATGTDENQLSSTGTLTAPIEILRPSLRNPRGVFLERELEELAASIKERGILQPIMVRNTDSVDGYEIVAGERRWRAAQRAGLHSVPIIVISVSDKDALEISIIENVQRTDLNPLEEAKAYSLLASEYGYNQNDIGRVVGKSRSHVANTLRLLALPQHTRNLVETGAISAGHARAILPHPDADAIADQIVNAGLSVREVESLYQTHRQNKPSKTTSVDPDLLELEDRLSKTLGAKITVKRGKNGFSLNIGVSTYEQITLISDVLLSYGSQ